MLPVPPLGWETATVSGSFSFSARASGCRSRCPAAGGPAPRSSTSSSSSAALEKASCCRRASQFSAEPLELGDQHWPRPQARLSLGAPLPKGPPKLGLRRPTSQHGRCSGQWMPALRHTRRLRGSRGRNVASSQPGPRLKPEIDVVA
ncbi:hypothetical protein P7K49_008470 [Saguinus oedipus]|uniref:Uncharacterized protein n=1 Tax=Saguinus oedipus TaxID=9490 RepID=A0ABQ9VZF4_SAGOE|nr:hypothetical protein P7K49_008470 [Saguinus oedipus]